MNPLLATSGLESLMLFVLTIAVIVLAKVVLDLRAEVRSIRSQTPSKSGNTAVEVSAKSAPVATPPPLPPAPIESPKTSGDDIPADVYTAIVAAVHNILGERHRILSIHPTEAIWSREGRRTIFDSHTFR